MRITGGALRGRPLAAPPGRATRPTTDRTRQAVFNLVGARMGLGGARVLDLFAGSGALGLDALSRGAAHATFVETDPAALRALAANVRTLGLDARARTVRADVFAFLHRAPGPFDLVLADPPYGLARLPDLPDLMLPLVAPDGLLVLEHDARHGFDAHPALVTARTYGPTVVSLFEREA